MSEEQNTEAVVEETTQTNSPTEAQPQEIASAEAEVKTTLLSGDEGDGAGEYFYDAPEDFEVTEEVQAQLDDFADAATNLGLTQEQFQGLIDYQQNRLAGSMEAVAAEYTARANSWADDTQNDAELGGANFKRM